MPETSAAAISAMENKDKIIVALDVDNAHEALSIAGELKGRVGAMKVGMQLFTLGGPDLVCRLCDAGHRVFLDLKFHDIPNTVAKAAVEATKLGVWMLNVHAIGGREMMRQTRNEVDEASEKAGIAKPLIIAVTVLTSSDANTLEEVGVYGSIDDQVVKLARIANECRLDGVVASAREVELIKKSTDTGFLTVTPGIRPKGATEDDQKRVTTFGQALANGSDFVVIGRPILKAVDRIKAVEDIISEAAVN